MTKRRKSLRGVGRTAESLYNIHKTLETQNGIIQQMLNIMPKESGKFTSVMEIVVLIAGAFGFISIADTILNWRRGG